VNLRTFMTAGLHCLVFSLASAIAGDCAPFHCGLDSSEAIAESNGTITGTLTFLAGVNGAAANFNGTADVRFTGSLFDSSSASVSLWFKKNSSDEKGGILEIGQLGTPNSIGVFYAHTDNVYFEMRNSNSELKVAVALNVLSQTKYTHIVAIWDSRDDTNHMKLFVNGRYMAGERLTGPLVRDYGSMRVGIAGVGEWYGHGEGSIDELRFFDWALSDGEVYGEYVYSANRHRHQPTGKPISTGPVKLVGKTLTVNDEPFIVRGVGYQPIPIGMSPDKATLDYVYTNSAIIQRDTQYLKKMNANTVRLWAELPDATLLDALEVAGIYAIMAFQVPSSNEQPGIDYGDPATIQLYTDKMIDYVNRFKNHPAVLAWAIGNENNLHYDRDISDWYKLANKLAQAAYEAEEPAYHPTVLVNGYMLFFGDVDYCSDDISLSYVDIWGHNTYVRYDYHSYFCYFDKVTAKPLIMTEFGVDAYGAGLPSEHPHVQAEWVVHEWEQIEDSCLGGTVMEYCDEWWKCSSPSTHDSCGYYTDVQPDGFSNEEWYGVMEVEDGGSSIDIMHPREIYCALRQAFSGQRLPSDLDPDGSVDFYDFSVFSGQWLEMDCYENDCCDGADVDHSGEVDAVDLAAFCNDWLEAGE